MTDEVRITETTQARLGDVRVGVANLRDGEFELADGETVSGPSVLLMPEPGDIPDRRVGAGSVVALGDADWQVVDVTPGPEGRRGSVTLRRC